MVSTYFKHKTTCLVIVAVILFSHLRLIINQSFKPITIKSLEKSFFLTNTLKLKLILIKHRHKGEIHRK